METVNAENTENTENTIDTWYRTVCLITAVGVVLLAGTGCAKKSLETEVGAQSLQQGLTAPGRTGDQARAPVGQPDRSLSEQDVVARAPVPSDPADPGSTEAGRPDSMGTGASGSPGMGSGGASTEEGSGSTGIGGSGSAGSDPGGSGSFGIGPGGAESSGMEPGGSVASRDPLPAIGSGSTEGGTSESSGAGHGEGPLKGFEPVTPGKTPQEETVGSKTMVAKADPSAGVGERLEEMQREQLATAAAGLQDVFFGFDSWVLTETGRQSLAQAAKWLRENPGKRLTIEGHCDERGTVSYNFVLGEKRALAIRNYLIELGVDRTQLMVVSFGKERPFCKLSTEDCYQQNRRGHLVVRSK